MNTYVDVRTCACGVCRHVWAEVHVRVRGGCGVSPPIASHLIFSETASLTEPGDLGSFQGAWLLLSEDSPVSVTLVLGLFLYYHTQLFVASELRSSCLRGRHFTA